MLPEFFTNQFHNLQTNTHQTDARNLTLFHLVCTLWHFEGFCVLSTHICTIIQFLLKLCYFYIKIHLIYIKITTFQATITKIDANNHVADLILPQNHPKSARNGHLVPTLSPFSYISYPPYIHTFIQQ